MAKPKNLRRPIQSNINGKSVTLVTIGFCALALGRTTACLKNWETHGIFPPAAFRVARSRHRLYPEDFLSSISHIKDQGYLGRRMNRSNWRRFQTEVWNAHLAALAPFRSEDGVIELCTDGESREGRQGPGMS
jgi:hypothetical protein